ncbi:hypothetical protein [Oceanisphaera arctica]|uniref:hypothetical protein n=1 Tax=Oceanisphaera arctica TaxID=641510 RepID=UPI0015E2C2FD|nr:hypothetical protein [Oceanisphaera arctica]GHA05385.1 hypothetical protein GCM10007082_02850 [Oceanisphaera arctica]
MSREMWTYLAVTGSQLFCLIATGWPPFFASVLGGLVVCYIQQKVEEIMEAYMEGRF